MKIKFFAWLKDELGADLELNELDSVSIAELKNTLIQQLGKKAEILGNQEISCAVNYEFISSTNQIVHKNDEIAFFPPVTGG